MLRQKYYWKAVNTSQRVFKCKAKGVVTPIWLQKDPIPHGTLLVGEIIKCKKELRAEISLMEQYLVSEGIKALKTFYEILHTKEILRLLKVYRKYVNLAVEKEDRELHTGDRQYLDDKFPYKEIKTKAKRIFHKGWVGNGSQYRDEIYEAEGVKYYYLWGHCIVVEFPNKFLVDSCGYKTFTTKDRINKYLQGTYGLWGIKSLLMEWIYQKIRR